jgi:N-acetylmuramoyl-L-alanine amidase
MQPFAGNFAGILRTEMRRCKETGFVRRFHLRSAGENIDGAAFRINVGRSTRGPVVMKRPFSTAALFAGISGSLLTLLLPSIASELSTSTRHIVALDIGHTLQNGGARSARGVMEFEFNKKMVGEIYRQLEHSAFIRPLIINSEGKPISLYERTQAAAAAGSELFLSVHHDAVQPKYLNAWTVDGHKEHYSDRFKGFSVFYSSKNPLPDQSEYFAHQLGIEMKAKGFEPSLHHAEKIPGEGRTLVEPEYGVYDYDDLIVLKSANIPAALIECGVIVNRAEEESLSEDSTRSRIAAAVSAAILHYFEGQRASAPSRESSDGPVRLQKK